MLFKNRLPNLVRRFLAPVLAMVGCLLVAATATAGPIGDVFIIAMENHNFTQPRSTRLRQRCSAIPPPPI